MTMAEAEDKIVKDVLMHGFKADERTCSEAKLRFLMQQKTSLIDQWRYTRTALLKELGRKLDQIDRKDIESLVQIPSGDDEALNEIDEDDLLEEDEEEEESDEDEIVQNNNNNALQNNNNTGLNGIKEENEDEYENEDIVESLVERTTTSQLSPINEQKEIESELNKTYDSIRQVLNSSSNNNVEKISSKATVSPSPDLPSYKSNQSPVLTPVLSAVTSGNDMERLRQRVADLENYVKREVAEIKQELENLSL